MKITLNNSMVQGSVNGQVTLLQVGTDNDQSGGVNRRISEKVVGIMGKMILKCDYLLNILAYCALFGQK
ncbi:MAG: hypothetical protein IJ057_01775 [Bacteroidales bacterium]|nr:hypothetical protein [Bacteroidales bacterium]